MEEPRPVLLTIEDYDDLPDDGNRYEILEGWLEVTPAPHPDHQDACGRIHFRLLEYVRSGGGGRVYFSPIDVVLAPDTVCQPDLLYIRAERVTGIVQDRIRGAPDLVIEVLSPTTARRDRVRKCQIYARFGVREYWIVDLESKTVLLHTLQGQVYGTPRSFAVGDALESPVLPGFRMWVAEVMGLS